MKTSETGFQGLLVIEPQVWPDPRGYFFESFNRKKFLEAGLNFLPVQDNESSSVRGVIRGLHYQINPDAQSKLIRVVLGEIYDVALDLRSGSPTFGKWFGIKLSAESRKMLFIPKGFAHGFSVLSERTIIQYKCDNLYNPASERGIRFDDQTLSIDWLIEKDEYIVSQKDMGHPSFEEADHNFLFEKKV